MGRSYCYECSRCGYRATVSGRPDRGCDVFVQTILCRDCRKLYDAVTRLRIVEERALPLRTKLGLRLSNLNRSLKLQAPPAFQVALNRLPAGAGRGFQWLRFKLQCPQSSGHRIQAWNEPGECPKCGITLERHALPYRIWD